MDEEGYGAAAGGVCPQVGPKRAGGEGALERAIRGSRAAKAGAGIAQKSLASSRVDQRLCIIEPKNAALPVTLQCNRLGLTRHGYYHQPEPEWDENLRLMRVIDETYLAYPCFGSVPITHGLWRHGHSVNCRRTLRFMLQIGLKAIYRKPNLSRKQQPNAVLGYLLRRLAIDQRNQVCAMDTTSLLIQGGFIYLCAVINW